VDGGSGVAGRGAEAGQLAAAGGGAGLVAELLVDGEGLLVAAFGLGVVASVLGQDAELVVAGGGAGLVAELLFDGEGLLVAAFGLGVVAPVLGEDAELVAAPAWLPSCSLMVRACW
jgi:hypothetical protein